MPRRSPGGAGRCRACGGGSGLVPLVVYEGMPGGAQHLPKGGRLEKDDGIPLTVVHCPCCGVVQLSNPPVRYWRDVIRAVGFSEEMLSFRRGQFEAFVRRHGLRGQHGIEAGCGDGSFLALLAETGLNVRGLENSAENVGVCRQKGLTVDKGFLRHGDVLDGAPFDAFFVFSYLEHLTDARDFLCGLRGNLRDGAVGIVEVPDFDLILKRRLFSEFIIDHLLYFTRETLVRTLENNGFDVLNCGAVWHDYILSAEIVKRGAVDLATLSREQTAVVALFRDFVSRCGRVAVWGAGHQSFTMLAMIGDVRNIAYIIDSAPFKQGHYSPVTHIPVREPTVLIEEPVDALIVMGGSYSDEIAELARMRYGQNVIAVFRDNTLEMYRPPEQ